MSQSTFEIDDTPLVEANFTYTAKMLPAEPDIGIFHSYHEIEGEITGGKLGGLILSRAQMIEVFGQDEIERLEGFEAASLAERHDAGEFQEAAE